MIKCVYIEYMYMFLLHPCRFFTPLHVATDKGQYDVMDLLLKHGAKVSLGVESR